jgi:hypothetical protein
MESKDAGNGAWEDRAGRDPERKPAWVDHGE